jgi:hypothetical protein
MLEFAGTRMQPLEERLSAYCDRLDRSVLDALGARAPLRSPVHLIDEARS